MLKMLYRITPCKFFIVTAICLEIVFSLITPPLQAPDEFNHFYRAYQISEGDFLPVRTSNRLGGKIPGCFNDFISPYFNAATNVRYTLNKDKTRESSAVLYSDSILEFKDFPNTAYYSPVSYVPQALAIFILKQFNCKVSSMYYAGRIFAFVFWLTIMFLVIRILPVYKWLFTALILLPMNLYVANSFSADTVTNCLSFLFIALVLKYTYKNKKVPHKILFCMLVLLGLLALAKVVYVGLAVLLFLIPAHNFRGGFFRLGYISAAFITCITVIYLWSSIIMKYYITFPEYDPQHTYYSGISPCGNYYAQKEYIFNNGLYFLKVIWRSIFNHPQRYLSGYIGVFGQSDIGLPFWIHIFSYLFILFLGLTERVKYFLFLKQKTIIFIGGLACFVLLILSQHLIWDCVGEGVVDLIQGRYLIPVFPLFFILLNNNFLKFKYSPLLLVLPFLIIVNLISCKLIYERFYIDDSTSSVEFFCDMEKRDEQGLFITSNPAVKLSGGTSSSDSKGNCFGVLMPPSSQNMQYGFSYQFKNLNPGSLVEIEALEIGREAHLVISGKGTDCKDFYFAGKNHFASSKKGWNKVSLIFTMPTTCSNSEVNFYIWNPSNKKIQLDDIKFSIKRF